MAAGVLGAIAPAPEPLFPDDILETTRTWLRNLSLTWREEIPLEIHSHEIDHGGAPQLHPAFLSFIERDCRKPGCHDLHCKHGQDRPNPRKRTHKALRKLRRVAPREFDALYLMIAHEMTFSDVARAMTERAQRISKPDHYDEAGVLVLVVSGIDKISRWY